MKHIPGPDNGKDYNFSALVSKLRAGQNPNKVNLDYMPFTQSRMVVNTRPHTVCVTNLKGKGIASGFQTFIYTFKSGVEFYDWRHSDKFDPHGIYRINKEKKVLAYEDNGKSNFFGEVGTHIDNIFPGARLFQLKATHGVPLEISLENLTRRSMVVDWTDFVKEARLSGWYDFQTLEVIQNALADVFDRDVQEAVILRIKRFILKNPMTT